VITLLGFLSPSPPRLLDASITGLLALNRDNATFW
jgi:hypothetical protein